MKYRKLLTAMAAGALLVALISANSTPAIAGIGDNQCYRFESAERHFKRRINRARVNAGKVRLKLDPELGRVARVHAQAMARKGYIYHQSHSQLGGRVTRWVTLGENVGVGSTVRSLHRAFMNSPGHRANVLYSSFRNVGVGTTKRHGRLWVTVVFESQNNPGTTLRMPSC